ncbi:ATP-binding protein [uncultured Pseudacidovorax sp.]|uniref:ATP-binding protein n=1 Tax=uncultured Pseudacidovorax sp. TaxID=679313 RepID=UPI0025F24460|nr:ATP-binding protein [uncultured Pseudacidovorax sp.]
MIERSLSASLRERLAFYPGVVLLGPRQVGKTTLARAIAAEHPQALVLDLERPSDRAQLAEPELFLSQHRDRLVVLDEVQMMPDLFTHLRPEIDADRRPGRFLLLGSASGALLRQRAESLAGRVGYLELTPLLAAELPQDLSTLQQLWLRGGFPLAYLAPSERLAFAWRQDFIQTFLQRDLPLMGVGVAADTLHRFWRMLAHLQGQLFNASQLGQSLGGASHSTAARYLDLLVDTLLVRRLEPFFPNVGKRLVKSPKVYLRDSGLLHALLGIASLADLQGHPIVGASWEGFVVEQVAAHLPEGAQLGFYRTAAGTELDIVIERGSRRLGIEVKFSAAPTVGKGFWQARTDLELTRAVVVAPVERAYPLREGVAVVPVWQLPSLLDELG